jgi:hypothetical protein
MIGHAELPKPRRLNGHKLWDPRLEGSFKETTLVDRRTHRVSRECSKSRGGVACDSAVNQMPRNLVRYGGSTMLLAEDNRVNQLLAIRTLESARYHAACEPA